VALLLLQCCQHCKIFIGFSRTVTASRKPNFYSHVHKNPSLDPALSQLNPIHILTLSFSDIHFILFSYLRLCSLVSSLEIHSTAQLACYVSRPSHHPLFSHSDCKYYLNEVPDQILITRCKHGIISHFPQRVGLLLSL
jgi:hypothetical protein